MNAADKHTAALMFRMTEEEKRELRRRADTAGLTQSDFIRRQLGMRYSLGKNPASVSAFGK